MRVRPMQAVFIAVVATALMPAPARADGLITPFFGANFGGDAGDCSSAAPCSTDQLSYGLGIGFMVGGVVGFEGEIAYAPHFFGKSSERGDNEVFTAMGTVLVGIPLKAVRPYVTGGLGLVHTNVSQSSIGLYDAYSNNSFAFEAGGGLIGMFSEHVGVRGDVRYTRTLQDLNFTAFELENKQLQFWRGAFGVVFRF